jgi:hypothetical protein
LYVEGTLAYSRYDPTFVATDGAQQRPLPTRWNTFSTTVGIGWDFRITNELVFRPILNGTIGRVSSDLKIGQSVVNRVTDRNLQFLQNGSLDAYGYGGSLVLDLEHYRETYEIDAELRATDIYLRSFGSTSDAVQGSAMAQQVSLWTRWRAPTGWHALDRPIRYVLEFAYSHYIGRWTRTRQQQISDRHHAHTRSREIRLWTQCARRVVRVCCELLSASRNPYLSFQFRSNHVTGIGESGEAVSDCRAA